LSVAASPVDAVVLEQELQLAVVTTILPTRTRSLFTLFSAFLL
jgi:hypothetical protein